MVSFYVNAGIGLMVVLVIVMVYYANRTAPNPGACNASVKCPDTWRNLDGSFIEDVVKKCVGGQFVTPGVGPGKCTNPCSSGQTPCWDAKTQQGICYPGVSITCPCSSDADCGGATQGSCSANRTCVCKPGWSGLSCEVKGGMPCSPTVGCGPNGTCVTSGSPPASYCVCKPGWVDNVASGRPCSACAAGWGPPIGSPDYAPANYCSGVFYSGITVPVPVGLPLNPPQAGHVVECGSNANLDLKCKNFFGPTFSATGATDSGVCDNCQGEGDYAVGCTGNNGFWASPTFDATNYNPWAFSGCKMALPKGFVLPLA